MERWREVRRLGSYGEVWGGGVWGGMVRRGRWEDRWEGVYGMVEKKSEISEFVLRTFPHFNKFDR